MYQKLLHYHMLNQSVTLHDFFLGRNVEFLVLYKSSLYENKILIYINYVNQYHFVLIKHCEMVVNVDNYHSFTYDFLILDVSIFIISIVYLLIFYTFI